jgi:hypothetical protein
LYPKTSAGNTRPIAARDSFIAQTRRYKISKKIVKIDRDQQVNGGVAECVMIVGTWFNSCGGFLIFFSSNR